MHLRQRRFVALPDNAALSFGRVRTAVTCTLSNNPMGTVYTGALVGPFVRIPNAGGLLYLRADAAYHLRTDAVQLSGYLTTWRNRLEFVPRICGEKGQRRGETYFPTQPSKYTDRIEGEEVATYGMWPNGATRYGRPLLSSDSLRFLANLERLQPLPQVVGFSEGVK